MSQAELAATNFLPQYAEVAVPLRVVQTYTYRLPTALRAEAQVGARLLVPFGRKLISAYIVALHEQLDEELEFDIESLKDAEELLDVEPLLTPQVIALARWISSYYAASWGEVLKAALPAGLNATIDQILNPTAEGRDELARLPVKKLTTLKARALHFIHQETETTLRQLAQHVGESGAARAARELERAGWIKVSYRPRSVTARAKRRKAVRLLPPELHKGNAARALSSAQQRVVETLLQADGEMNFTDLIEAANTSASVVGGLERRGIVETFARDVRRDPLAGAQLPADINFHLTDAQAHAFQEIAHAIDGSQFKAFLLHGITGSGKTEVYIRAMRHAIEQGRSALMLVPEIALTPVFSRRLRAHFGDAVAILHSSLSTGERFDEWSRIRRGEARVVIGTRSAIFAPMLNLGVIIIDEEHEATYRQQEAPYYNGRDAAVVRASKENAVVVLGSATPSLETFHNSRRGKYAYLELPARIADRPLATAEIVDMRQEFEKRGKQEIFSERLLDAIRETHERGEQAIILLNRRGYSSFVLCRSCGERMQCPNCDVTLTFHRSQRSLVCHYCDFRAPVPNACPACKGEYIYFLGEGTEQLEDKLRAMFPAMRIARLDRDTTARKRLFEETILQFGERKLDLLVGTQMLAKGHDFPNVTLVGVVSIDAGLALPDFRAAERTFQLLTQVAGRAGRGSLPGRVLVQTFHPEHYALRHAARQDYFAFYDEEIAYRRNLSYPPFVALASFTIHHESFMDVQTTADELRRALDAENRNRACRVLGPAPAPLARLRNEHRYQILVKSTDRAKLRTLVDLALDRAAQNNCDVRSINLEIDPINLM